VGSQEILSGGQSPGRIISTGIHGEVWRFEIEAIAGA
jgi:hypothetical protein